MTPKHHEVGEWSAADCALFEEELPCGSTDLNCITSEFAGLYSQKATTGIIEVGAFGKRAR